MQDLMIDFETLGTGPNTIVISVGAQFFDLNTGEYGPTFYMAFDIEDQMKKGRVFTPSTLKWWMSQSNGAKKVFHEQAKPTKQILETFAAWCKSNCGKKYLKPWGNGATFDISIMESLFSDFELECPWLYYNVMDMRTFRRFIANDAKVPKEEGVNHHALDDAKNQIKFCMEHYSFFKQMIEAFKNLANEKPHDQANAGQG